MTTVYLLPMYYFVGRAALANNKENFQGQQTGKYFLE